MDKFLIINKEKGYTSRDVVNILTKIFGIKKIGHFGTLDPLATGVLVVGIGKYTKFCDLDLFSLKEYQVEVLQGVKTDTYDITGKVLALDNHYLSREEVLELLKTYTKTYLQEVPIYSAVKVNGKKLYEYARENLEVILPKKEVTIFKNELLAYSLKTFTFKTEVSKGTYIRSLINDMANSKNCLLTMQNLKRLRQGPFTIADAYTLDSVKAGNFKFLDLEDILDYDIAYLDAKNKNKILNGAYILKKNKDYLLFLEGDEKKVLYRVCQDNKMMKPFLFF